MVKNLVNIIKGRINKIFWILALLFGSLAIINQTYFIYKSILLQFLITVGFAIIAIFLLLKKTQQGFKFWEYWQGSVIEIKKVTWPTRKEITQFTGAVVFMVFIMGIILWTVDSILIRLVAWLLKRGSI